MKKLTIIFLGLIIMFLMSCEFFLPCKDQEITIPKIENTSNKLKLNGYYYDTVVTSSNHSLVYMFYRNSIFYNWNSADMDDSRNGNIFFDSGIIDYKTWWGLYEIKGDSIEIQYWDALYTRCYKVAKQKGVIINDTCFMLEKRYNYSHKEWIDDYHFFVFKQYSPKPDSTNAFF